MKGKRFFLSLVVAGVVGAVGSMSVMGNSASAGERIISVLIFPIQFSGVKLTKTQQNNMRTYLGTRLTRENVYRVMPEDQIRQDLGSAKVASYQECYDEACRLDLTRALSASKSLSVMIENEGRTCRVTANLYDTEQEITEAAADVESGCGYAQLKRAMQSVAAQLSGKQRATPVVTQAGTSALPPPPEMGVGGVSFGGSEPPPAIKAEVGYLSVEGTPKGARVDISGPKSFGTNGRAATSLPVRPFQVPAGEYRIGVSMTGYDTAETTARVFADATEVAKVDLVQSSGQIQISGSPSGAKSRLECQKGFSREFGLPSSSSPWTVTVPRGQCRLTVERDGYEGHDATFEVAGGVLVRQTVDMKRGVSTGKGWVRIPAGSFVMGSPSGESGRDSDEGPQTRVTITHSFLLKSTEVTQGEWKSVMGDNPSYFKNCGNDCPVEQVSWFDAVTYCNKLSAKEGLEQCYQINGKNVRSKGLSCKGYRLPTEAEWEYASRAGTSTAIYTGNLTIKGDNNGPELDPIAWYGGNSGVNYSGGYDCSGWKAKQYSSSRCGTHPVAKKRANAWGLYDMLGNVYEWCEDWKGTYSGGSVTDPTGPSSGSDRVIRGGSWDNYARYVRAAFRSSTSPATATTTSACALPGLSGNPLPFDSLCSLRAGSFNPITLYRGRQAADSGLGLARGCARGAPGRPQVTPRQRPGVPASRFFKGRCVEVFWTRYLL